MIYEYECPKCGEFEVEQKISDKKLKKCPTCKSKVKRLISKGGSFILRGTGWFRDGY